MQRRTVFKIMLGATMVPFTSACQAAGSFARDRARDDLYVCDGCEAVGERSFAGLRPSVDLAGPIEPGEKLILKGTVYQSDGRTPASGVVIYAHHTNVEGHYAGGNLESTWSRRHGRLRGWIKTDRDGGYQFLTIKPGVYPNRNSPAHIHLYVAEPNRQPYWIDDVVFAGEFGVDERYRRTRENRGGGGIVELKRASNLLLAHRDIILEIHPS